MKYQVSSAKFQNYVDTTIDLIAFANELGSIETIQTGVDEFEEPIYADVLTITLADLSENAIAATDVLIAKNLSEATNGTAAITEDGLYLTITDTAIASSDLMDVVIRMK